MYIIWKGNLRRSGCSAGASAHFEKLRPIFRGVHVHWLSLPLMNLFYFILMVFFVCFFRYFLFIIRDEEPFHVMDKP